GRFPDRAALRWHWPRPCAFAQARSHDGRRRNRDERNGQGIGVHAAPAQRRRTVKQRFGTPMSEMGSQPIKLRASILSPLHPRKPPSTRQGGIVGQCQELTYLATN